jgi:hypothetical protein
VFWFLLFAHFIADYPLQTTWIVKNKNQTRVLLLHVSVHLLVGLVFILLYAPQAWPFMFLLASIHFLIDFIKNHFSSYRPPWVITSYFIDQFVHLISLILIAQLIARYSGIPPYALKPLWLIVLIAYLVVTYVWYISERIIAIHDSDYFKQVVDGEWSRMLARAMFLSLTLIAWFSFMNPRIIALSALAFPYKGQKFATRALFIDLVIAVCGAIFVLGTIS